MYINPLLLQHLNSITMITSTPLLLHPSLPVAVSRCPSNSLRFASNPTLPFRPETTLSHRHVHFFPSPHLTAPRLYEIQLLTVLSPTPRPRNSSKLHPKYFAGAAILDRVNPLHTLVSPRPFLLLLPSIPHVPGRPVFTYGVSYLCREKSPPFPVSTQDFHSQLLICFRCGVQHTTDYRKARQSRQLRGAGFKPTNQTTGANRLATLRRINGLPLPPLHKMPSAAEPQFCSTPPRGRALSEQIVQILPPRRRAKRTTRPRPISDILLFAAVISIQQHLKKLRSPLVWGVCAGKCSVSPLLISRVCRITYFSPVLAGGPGATLGKVYHYSSDAVVNIRQIAPALAAVFKLGEFLRIDSLETPERTSQEVGSTVRLKILRPYTPCLVRPVLSRILAAVFKLVEFLRIDFPGKAGEIFASQLGPNLIRSSSPFTTPSPSFSNSSNSSESIPRKRQINNHNQLDLVLA